MADTADLWSDDEGPPSGVRERLFDGAAGDEPAPLSTWLAPSPPCRHTDTSTTPEVLAEVTEEVVREVWRIVRAISPLRLRWTRIRPVQLVAMAGIAAQWRWTSSDELQRAFGRRWPELVPGHEAMNVLATVMVDALC